MGIDISRIFISNKIIAILQITIKCNVHGYFSLYNYIKLVWKHDNKKWKIVLSAWILVLHVYRNSPTLNMYAG